MDPKITSSSLAARSWALAAVWLILITAGLGGLPVRGINTTNTIEFAKSVPQPGSVQWETERELSKKSQETHRKRLSIEDATSPFIPRATQANLINGPKTLPVHLPSKAGVMERFLDLCFFTAILLLTAGLAARKFAPELLADLNQRYNPWAVPPAGARNHPDGIRSEEKAFGEFLATLRTGPAAAPRTEAPATEMPRAEFYGRAKKRLANQRRMCEEIGRQAGDAMRKKRILDLYYELGALKAEAAFPEALPVWQLASAMEGLLREIGGKINNVTPSMRRTILGGLDVLDKLCIPGSKPDLLTNCPFKFLVVDDDLISRQALALSLKKAFSQPDQAVDGFAAVIHTARQAYDVIFLDVQMPGMDGFELCRVIHDSELNRSTPVVFVTSQSDFDARAKSTLIGGNDLMGKPFLIFEVTVKALTLALQGRLLSADGKPAPNAETARAALDSPAPAAENTRNAASPALKQRLPPATAPVKMNAAAKAFLNRAGEQLSPLRELSERLLKADDDARRQNLLSDGFLRINSWLARDGSDVMHPAYQLSSALEGLFRKLLQDAHSTPTALGSIAAAVDLLTELCLPGLKADLGVNPPIRLLVVDDDLVARRALAGALQTNFKRPESVDSGEAALTLAREEPFDVVFLDLQMPGMDGFETCSKIRETGLNQSTPVVFVTAHRDFAYPAGTSHGGGNDLVEKPFLTSEINLKALTYALRSRLRSAKLEA
jgi:CheY-like chemotaxis protein